MLGVFLLERTSTTKTSSDHSLRGRAAAACVTLLFCGPVCFLLWMLANYWATDALIPLEYCLAFVAALVVFGFAFPRVIPSVFGWLSELLFSAGRY